MFFIKICSTIWQHLYFAGSLLNYTIKTAPTQYLHLILQYSIQHNVLRKKMNPCRNEGEFIEAKLEKVCLVSLTQVFTKVSEPGWDQHLSLNHCQPIYRVYPVCKLVQIFPLSLSTNALLVCPLFCFIWLVSNYLIHLFYCVHLCVYFACAVYARNACFCFDLNVKNITFLLERNYI